jgi:hypothetical protein
MEDGRKENAHATDKKVLLRARSVDGNDSLKIFQAGFII